MVSSTSLVLHDGSKPTDAIMYMRIVGSLQYISLTRPDIAYSVNKLVQFMHTASDNHWSVVKRILQYLKATRSYGLFLKNTLLSLHAFLDADWASNRDDRTSMIAYIVFLGANPISWSSKKQKSFSNSSIKAEYRVVANIVSKVC